MPPEGEGQLRQLAQRFDDAESRVRALIAQAPEGDRRELLTEALEILVALRRLDFRDPLTTAYRVALDAARVATRRTGARARGADDLAGSLAQKLDEAAKHGSAGSRRAFRAVTDQNLDDLQHDAVTARVDADGKRWTLGSLAGMLTTTIGRRASSRGTLDGVGPEGFVTVSSHGTKHPICIPLEGKTFPAGSAPQPPFHPACKHYLTPG